MNSKRALALMLGASLALSLMSGCGSDNTGGGNEGGEEQVTLTFFHYKDTVQEAMEKMAEAFHEKYPNVTVQVEMAATEYQNLLASKDASNSLPDIFALSDAGPTGLEEFVTNDKIITVDGFENLAMLDQEYVDGMKYQDASYMVPLITTGRGMIYNEELLAQVGYTEPPETLTELKDCAAKLKEAGIIPFAVGASEVWTLGNTNFLIGWDALTDLDWVQGMYEGTSSFSVVDEWFDFFDFFIENTQPNPISTKHADACALMATEQAAIYFQGPWIVDTIAELDETVANKLRMAPAAFFEDASKNVILNDYDMYVAVKNGENAEWAQKFLEFMVADEAGIEIFKNDLKVINPYGIEYDANPCSLDILRLVEEGKSVPGENFQNMPKGLAQEYGSRLQLYMTGELTREEFYQQMDAKWQEMSAAK